MRKSHKRTKSVSVKDNRPDIFTFILVIASIIGFLSYTGNNYYVSRAFAAMPIVTIIANETSRDITEYDWIVKVNNPINPVENTQYFKDSKQCLAENLYFEARGTSKWEMIRVINVVMNRLHDSNYPSKICDVIWQYRQFSWTLDPDLRYKNYKNRDKAQWKIAFRLAEKALIQEFPDITGGARFYHNFTVKPGWSRNKEVALQSKWHIYYK